MTDEVKKTDLSIKFKEVFEIILKTEKDLQNISNEIKQIDKRLTQIENKVAWLVSSTVE